MHQVPHSVPGWTISTRRNGEVLSAQVQGAGLELAFLGRPEGFDAPEIEEWLRELIGVAEETSRGPAPEPAEGGPAIPRLLHNLLTGLLFYRAELWPGEAGPCTVVVMDDGNTAGFGCVGEADLVVFVDGEPVMPLFARVRDEEGHTARAFVLDRSRSADLFVEWRSESPSPLEASIEARWAGVSAAEAGQKDAPRAFIVPREVDLVEPLAVDPVVSPTPATELFARPTAKVEAWDPEGPARVEKPSLVPEPQAESAHSESIEAWAPEDSARAAEPSHVPEPQGESTPSEPVEAWDPGGSSRDVEPSLITDPLAEERRSIPMEAWEPSGSSASDDAAPVEYPEPPARLERGDWHFKSWVDGLARSVEASVEAAEAAEVEIHREERVATHEPEAFPEEPEISAPEFEPGVTPSPDPAPLEPWADRLPPIVHDASSVPELVPPSPEFEELAAKAAPIDWIEPVFEAPSEPTPTPGVESGAMARASSEPSEAAHDPGGPRSEAEAMTYAGTAGERSPATRTRRLTRSGPARPLDLSAPDDQESRAARARRFAPWAGVVLVLFVGGWLLGSMDLGRKHGGPGLIARTFDRLGFGPARFDLAVTSRPEGAVIMVDGTEVKVRTPAVVPLPPGVHQITLSFPGLGSASYNVRGQRGQRVPLESALWGSLIVSALDASPAVAVSVDEIGRGMAPMTVDSLSPGIHQVRFSGPGIQPWERAVEVRVNEAAEVIAQGTLTPATGFVEVRATLSDEAASRPLSGATVWVDGAARGSTPLRLELPQGPHSLRVEYRGEEAPVQVLDLPGGNQRFVTFELGGAIARARLVQTSPFARIPLDQPTVMSAALEGVQRRDVREMWLHVRTQDGTWRRYPMNTLEAAAGVVGVSVFPNALFDTKGRAPYYLSASTQTGDEYFTEIRLALAAGDPSDR